MNDYTEQQIEEKLNQIASIKPGQDSVERTNQRVQRIISGSGRKQTRHSFFYYATASVAVLLIGISILYNRNPIINTPIENLYTQTEPQLTLAKLNAVFEAGGHQGLDDYFEMVEQNRQPRAETITLQQILKEL